MPSTHVCDHKLVISGGVESSPHMRGTDHLQLISNLQRVNAHLLCVRICHRCTPGGFVASLSVLIGTVQMSARRDCIFVYLNEQYNCVVYFA